MDAPPPPTAAAATMPNDKLYSSRSVIGLSGFSGITTLCRHMPQCAMVLFDKNLSRAFFLAQNDQMPSAEEAAKEIVADKDSISNISVFCVSARKNEFDASLKSIEKYVQMSRLFESSMEQFVIVAVNKMDAVKYSEERFRAIKRKMNKMLQRQNGFHFEQFLAFIPVSAERGDNMEDTSENMAWYGGDSLFAMMDKLTPKHAQHQLLGLPVIRCMDDKTVRLQKYEPSLLKTGDAVKFFPSGIESTVDSIRGYTEIVDVPHGGKVISVKIKKEMVSMQQMMLFGVVVGFIFLMLAGKQMLNVQ